MTFAKRNILRKIPTGPNPPITDYRLLLAGKLRAAWDVRVGGEFGPGVWQSHEDVISKLLVTAPADAQRPLCVADGTNFRGRKVIGITLASSRKMVNALPPSIVAGQQPLETYCIARLGGQVSNAVLVGYSDAGASSSGGAWLQTNSTEVHALAAGKDTLAAFSDTSNVHLFEAVQDGVNASLIVDGVTLASLAIGFRQAGTQIAVGGFASGFTSSADAFVACWGVISPPMTTAERAAFYAIQRNDWGF